MQNMNLYDALISVATQYPKDMVDGQVRDIARISFNISVALDAAKRKQHSSIVPIVGCVNEMKRTLFSLSDDRVEA